MRGNLCSLVWALLGTLVFQSPARGVDQVKVNKAIDDGVAALKRMQREDGTWPYPKIGATALAGLTLLECHVPKTSTAVQRAAEVIREKSITMTHTYSIALSILFLDRLGNPRDVPLIESLTVRLLAGQNAEGGWSYQCPSISDQEVRRLTQYVEKVAELKTRLPVAVPQKTITTRRTVKDLPVQIQRQLALLNRQNAVKPAPGRGRRSGRSDNSNTQFAITALWAARRHGLPVASAMLKVDHRFRLSQGEDGGWGYTSVVQTTGRARRRVASRDTMTCAGLLGLAVSHGSLREAKHKGHLRHNIRKDLILRNGLIALGSTIGAPLQNGRNVPMIRRNNGRTYYFLWSMERVAVALGLKTIGRKDWYEWGAQLLLANQLEDGTWRGSFAGSGADTCFALLFLRRANLTSDLTSELGGVVLDPGEVELKNGGVGGAALKRLTKPKLSSALDPDDTVVIEGDSKEPVDQNLSVTPAVGPEDKPSPLVGEVLEASGAEQFRLLEKYRDSKGASYTKALVGAIPYLNDTTQKKARQMLAERFTRMTSKTLERYLKSEEAEIRRAAALATAMKDVRSLVPEMIDLLADSDPMVVNATRAALKAMTRQDFGPEPDATPTEKQQAILNWKAWWSRQR